MGSNVPSVPMDPNLGGVQAGAMSGIQDMGQYTPQFQQAYYNQANNPYAQQAIQGAQIGGQELQGQGYNALNSANTFAGIPQQLSPFIQSTLNTAYDPQNNLYKRLSQANMDRTNVGLAQSGLQNTPWGQGVANESQYGFDTNWLQSQLGREQTGAGTVASLLGAGTGAATTGANLGRMGAEDIRMGGAMPYGEQTMINSQLAQMLPYLTANQQQQVEDYLKYYGAANQNTSNAIQAGSANNQQQSGMGQAVGEAAMMALMFL